MVDKKNNNVISRFKREPITNYCVKFIMRSVTFTSFFATKFMWKVVTSSNLNPQLKLFFY